MSYVGLVTDELNGDCAHTASNSRNHGAMAPELSPIRKLAIILSSCQIAIALSERRRTATTVAKRLAFCEDRSEARRAKRPNDCHCRRLCIGLTIAVALAL